MKRSARFRLLAVSISTTAALLVALALWRTLRPARPVAFIDDWSFYDQNGRPISRRAGKLKLMLDPATIYANWPTQQTAQFVIDERGFRATPRRDGLPQLVIVGGSAAFGWTLAGDQATFAWLLAQRFVNYEVVNAAVIGYLSGQELAQITQRLDNPRVKGYIIFDGWNDLADPLYYHGRPPLSLLGFNNTFTLIQDRLSELYRRDEADLARRDQLLPQRSALSEDEYLAAISDVYARNLDRMAAFARARGAAFLSVLQPELGTRPAEIFADPQVRDQALWYSSVGFAARYAAMRKATVGFCRARGISCVDVNAEPEFAADAESPFLDIVHMNERGHGLVAAIIERRLREMGLPSADHAPLSAPGK